MYAVIKTGGKQYKVAKDDIIKVEKLDGAAGDVISLDNVLMMEDGSGLKVGAPFVDGAAVAAEVLEQARGDKIIVFKKKRRQNYRRTRGHRQDYTVLKVTGIGGDAPKAKKAASTKSAASKATSESAPQEAKTAASETKAEAPKKAASTAKAASSSEEKAPAKKTASKAAASKTDASKAAPKKTAAKKDSE